VCVRLSDHYKMMNVFESRNSRDRGVKIVFLSALFTLSKRELAQITSAEDVCVCVRETVSVCGVIYPSQALRQTSA